MKGEVVGVVPTLGLASLILMGMAKNEDEVVAIDLEEGLVMAVEEVGKTDEDLAFKSEATGVSRAEAWA